MQVPNLRAILLTIFVSSLLSCNSNHWSSTAAGKSALKNLLNRHVDSFSGSGSLVMYTTNNFDHLPDVTRSNGRYRANLIDNRNNKTLHFMGSQGRIDAKKVKFPFEAVARNIGIGTQADTQIAPKSPSSRYIFSGIQVHVMDFNSINSSHVVVGHRGDTSFTLEGKNTVNADSEVNDEGIHVLPLGRADIRIIGNPDHTLTVYWQQPNLQPGVKQDQWKLYKNTGELPGPAPKYETNVYVGLITYAQGDVGVPFVGTCDSFEINF